MLRNFRVAIVEDEKVACKHLLRLFIKESYEVAVFHCGKEALEGLFKRAFSIVLLNLKLPDMDGLQILEEIKRNFPETEVIIMTGYGSIETAIEAIKKGAFHYLTKPVKPDELMSLVKKIEEKIQLIEENHRLKETLARYTFADLVDKSLKMQKIYRTIIKVARVDCNVLVHGETGTGKKLVARAIHYYSKRKEDPFVPFNCGAFTEELIARELFGYQKGAFTGAFLTKIGHLEAANKGTIFLNEIEEMPLSMQVKLLHAMEEKRITRVGGIRPIELNIRIIAATNEDLRKLVAAGKFRKDLFYRLNEVFIHLSPLRERKEDIPPLIQYFLKKYNNFFGKKINGITQNAMQCLLKYPYPGNVRELESIIERAVALAEGQEITIEDLPQDISEFEIMTEEEPPFSIAGQEKQHIQRALEVTGYNKTAAAKLLGLSRTTLWRKLKKYGLL